MEELKPLTLELSKNKKILAVYLFGSRALNKHGPLSDIDVCIIGNLTKKDKNKIQIEYGEEFDISFFDELPIFIKVRVFRDGKVLHVRDEHKIDVLKFITLQEYRDFSFYLGSRIREMFGNGG